MQNLRDLAENIFTFQICILPFVFPRRYLHDRVFNFKCVLATTA